MRREPKEACLARCAGTSRPDRRYYLPSGRADTIAVRVVRLLLDLDGAHCAHARRHEGVGHEGIVASVWNRQLDHLATAGGNRDGLLTIGVIGRIAVGVGVAKDRADDVER